MITLITGTPGAGKTCYFLDFLKQCLDEGRPTFQHGIKQLKLEGVERIYCRSLSCTVCEDRPDDDTDLLYVDQWHTWAPQHAAIFIDEIQHVYRPRATGAKVPQSVQAFETHRHKGLDFWIISQSPTLIDTNIRKLTGRHIHLKSDWHGRKQYEWPEVQSDTSRTASAVSSGYKLNKANFALYQSAEVHTKQKRKIPKQLWFLLASIVIAAALIITLIRSVSERISVNLDTETAQVDGADAPSGGTGAPERSSFNPIPQQSRNEQRDSSGHNPRLYDRVPRIIGMPESAPAYDHLVEVTQVPYIVGCARFGSTCNCRTQQGTRVLMQQHQCMDWIRNRPFNPYLDARAEYRERLNNGSLNNEFQR